MLYLARGTTARKHQAGICLESAPELLGVLTRGHTDDFFEAICEVTLAAETDLRGYLSPVACLPRSIVVPVLCGYFPCKHKAASQPRLETRATGSTG